MSRANGQWKEIAAGAPVLVVFQGENAYITPSWYATKRETGKVVPTWNYAVVQVRGTAKVIDDAGWLRTQIEALTGEHEGPRPAPWSVGDAPDAFVAAQLKGIIGVEIEITDIEGKWKVSQNRPKQDIAEVAEGLGAAAEVHANPGMAELVRRYGVEKR
jgi:transcriptional regulator